MLIVVCVLSPAQLEHDLSFTAFRLCFGGVLRGQFVQRTWFDRVPAGTVLAGTQLFRTCSDYKKWCVPRTYIMRKCSRWNCTENKCEHPVCQSDSNSVFTHTKIIIYMKPPTDFQLISELVNSGHCKMQIIITWLLVTASLQTCF